VKKRTEITIEYDETTFISLRPAGSQYWCSGCGTDRTMITPEQASAIARVSVRTINQMVEADDVHFIETANRLLLICLNSLNDRARNGSPFLKRHFFSS
jgi:hypothetical protein